MLYWFLFSLLGVFVVKYYTSIEMRKLERRLERVKEGLGLVKDKLASVQEKQNRVQGEEGSYEEHVRWIKETIEDLEIRLIASGEGEDDEEVVVSNSAPAARAY